MGWQWLLLAIFLQTHLQDITCKEIIAQVNPKRLIQYVPERFLSMTIDPGSILLAGNLGNEALTMARSLSPSFVRVGGKSTKYIKFGKELLMENTTITEEQWDSVCKFSKDAGLDLITSINPTDRINGVWDSRDALELISYSDKQGYNVAWQLGYDTDGISASGAEVGRDIVRLRKILDGFNKYSRSPIFGPDLPDVRATKDAIFVRDLLYQAGPVLGALFIQPHFKPEEDPGHTIMNAIINLDNNVWGKALRFGRIIPRKPIWIAEKELSQGRSEDAIKLVKRLGAAARIGVQIVMRQVGPAALNKPTPEFWVALMYKNLVGRGVLDARINSGNRSEIPIYSHCTPALPQEKCIIDAGSGYDKAVTVFGVNESPEDITVSLKAGMREEKVHIYSLTFAGGSDGQAEQTFLNGQPLTLSPTGELPTVSPRIVLRPSKFGITIPGKSVFFIVLPDVKSRMCSSSSTPFIQPGEVKDLSKRLIQVATNIFDKPKGHTKHEEEDLNKDKIYVKFGKKTGSPQDLSHNNLVVEAKATTLDDNSWVGKLADSMSHTNENEKQKAEAPEAVVEKLTILPETTISSENCTADIPETVSETTIVDEKMRKKRSASINQPIVNMEFSSANQNGVASQEELVKQFNSYANKVYESSRGEEAGGDIQITNIPEEIFNTLKKVKVTFKNLGTTSQPGKLMDDSSPTESPEKSSESENSNGENDINPNESKSENNEGGDDKEAEDSGLENQKEPSIFNEVKQEEVQRVPKDANVPENELNNEDIKDSLGTGENNFRDSQRPNDALTKQRLSESTQGEKVSQYFDTGTENQPSPESAGLATGEPKERIPRDESIREGESSTESSSDEGDDSSEENTRTDDSRSETETTNEPTKTSGLSEQSKSDRSDSSTVSNTVSNAGSINPPKTTNQSDNDINPKEKEKLVSAKNTNPLPNESPSSPASEIKDDTKKDDVLKILTTTEIPEVINVEGIKPKDVDALLLKIAKNEVKSSNLIKNVEASEEKEQKEELNENKDNKENEGKKDPGTTNMLEIEEKQITKDELKDNDIKATEKSVPEEDSETETSGETKLEEEEEEGEGADAEEDTLQNGPPIPTMNSPDTVKVVREIPAEDEGDIEAENDVTKDPAPLVADPTINPSEEKPNEKESESVPSNMNEPVSKEKEIPEKANEVEQSDEGEPANDVEEANDVEQVNDVEQANGVEQDNDVDQVNDEQINNKGEGSEDREEPGVSQEEDSQTSGGQTTTEKSDKSTEVKPLQVASFQGVPLEDSEDKSYTPKPVNQEEGKEENGEQEERKEENGEQEEGKEENGEQEDLKEVDTKDAEESMSSDPQNANDSNPDSEVEQSTGKKPTELSKDDETETLQEEEPAQVQQSANLVTIPLHSLIIPMTNPLATAPSTEAVESKVDSDKTENEESKTKLDNEKKDNETDLTKKSESRAAAEKERRLKLLAIRNQIMEARERFKAAAREEGWRAALQKREEEMRTLLHQERDKRKFIALPVASPERTLLSRPRRLTYDPSSSEVSEEEVYEYSPERGYNKRIDTYGLPLAEDYEKQYVNQQVLPVTYNNPTHPGNHIIFPLDPKAPQAVVYNNRIIPAKLYGVISINDEASKLSPTSPKQPVDLSPDSFLKKYFTRQHDQPVVKEKYEPKISEAPSLKPLESYTIPRDSYGKKLENQPNFIPVVVLSQKSNNLRKKRSLPDLEQPRLKTVTGELKRSAIEKAKIPLKKRSLLTEIDNPNYVNGILKGKNFNALDRKLISNDIKESLKLPREWTENPPTGVYYDYPPYVTSSEVGSWPSDGLGRAVEPRTFGSLAPLLPPPPLPLGLLPPIHPGFPEQSPGSKPQPQQIDTHRIDTLSPGPPPPPFFPSVHLDYPDPLPLPPADRHQPEPPQVYLFSMIQDKFKSILGMMESLAGWCGVNSKK